MGTRLLSDIITSVISGLQTTTLEDPVQFAKCQWNHVELLFVWSNIQITLFVGIALSSSVAIYRIFTFHFNLTCTVL